ncbi:Fic family protein [Bordetella sp. FB-8]|uniref:Fic family protein n=1 Tax=Bordetella sp. FB-8 TaxID=1159870 RepID=UPI0003668F87|nr:Fic family protein [Bordetella sp. FB-8]
MATPLGYNALIARFNLTVPPLRQTFWLGERATETRTQTVVGTERIELPRGRVSAEQSTVEQLTFALKREHLNLTVLGALFEHRQVLTDIQEWLTSRPTSSYARQAGYLAHWLAGADFAYRAPPGAPRVRLLNADTYLVGPETSSPQFAVVNNLLGSREFSPLVRKTEALQELLAEDLRAKVAMAMDAIEPEMLSRAVDYLYLSETRSTYGIEDEVPDNNRAAKFRHLLEAAGEPGNLSEEMLCGWQNLIVMPLSAEFGYRASQNWLSRPGRLRNIADFIPPPAELVRPMMDAVGRVAAYAAEGVLDPVVAATCAAFGLVFVHPFFDGNGRLHRFLLHHVLRQSGFTPAGLVLPLSARMLKQLDRYSALLKAYSKPRTSLLNYQLDSDSATLRVRSPQPLWLYAYFDATEICEFVLQCCKLCVEEDLVSEVDYLRSHDQAVRELETWLDMRQSKLNSLIDIIVQGHGALSRRKRNFVEELTDEQVTRVEEVVARNFAQYIDKRA